MTEVLRKFAKVWCGLAEGAESLFRGGGSRRAKVFYCVRSSKAMLHAAASGVCETNKQTNKQTSMAGRRGPFHAPDMWGDGH